MSHTRLALTATACIAALGLAGCSQADSGTPTPDTQASSPTTTSSSSSELEVNNPKNLEAVAAKPCQLLTESQLAKIGVTDPPKPGKSMWGESSCDWGYSSKTGITVSPATKKDTGLTSVLDDAGVAEPQKQVSGYPMVVAQELSYSCGVYVAANSEDVFFVNADVGSSESKDPCAVAKKAAGMVLSNLPPLNG